jgi:phenylacetate-CoA ligase
MFSGRVIYDCLPLWGQTAAVNAASARGYRRKYGGVFRPSLVRLARNEQQSLDQLVAEQRAALHALLRHAVAHVPFYRRLNCPVDDLSAWPILEKATVVAELERFISEIHDRRRLLAAYTSGTTGTPLTLRMSEASYQAEMAFRWRHKAWGGTPFLCRGAYVSGHPVVPANQARPPFWRVDGVEKRLLCSSLHLSPQNLGAYLDALAAYGPEFIHGYPSSLYLLAQQPGACRPKAIFTGSETLLDFQRRAIEEAFDAPVFNWYGNTEMSANIIQCAAGNLHERLDYGFLELLDDGSMVATGFNNPAMPLIRYRVGDRATRKAGACPCGCAFPLIERIEGRNEDYIRTPDGRCIGRMDHLFKNAHHVREAQIVQRQRDTIIIRIVRANGYSDADEQIVRREARQRLGDVIHVRFEYVDTIERTATGKFRFIVSELAN